MPPDALNQLGKFGMAGVLLAALLWLMKIVMVDQAAEIRKLGDDVDMLSRIVDLSCQPAKKAPP